jgi:IclR family KDG regulon transcriptional repressor
MVKRAILSLQKGLDILCCFNFDDEALSAQTISHRLNIPLSTTYRYLETLEERGFLTKVNDSKNYKLGFTAFQLGNIIAIQLRLVNIALPHMKSLALLSGETVFLSIISGWRTLVLETVETRTRIKLSVDRGSTLPLYAGAPSKILLAYQKESFIDSLFQKVILTKYTENTPTDPMAIREELLTIREQGFAFSYQEVDLGACAIAAPIRDGKGNVIACIAAAGPRERFSEENKPRLIQMVKDTASRISHELVYPPPP